MLAIPFAVALPLLAIWAVFQVLPAAWYFLGGVVLFCLWALAANAALRPKSLTPETDPYNFGEQEIEVFEKHPLYFRHPAQARMISSTCSLLQGSAVVVAAAAAFRQEWLPVALSVVAFFACANIAPLLNPGNFLRYHAARGSLTPELQWKLGLVESVEEKLQSLASTGK